MGHWYTKSGEAMHWVEKASGGGTRPTTIADGRKLSLLPSVTTILATLHKEALVQWLCRNAAVAAVTTPRAPGEELDAFVERVLSMDAGDESRKARDFGTTVHDEIESVLNGNPVKEHLSAYVNPVIEIVRELGAVQFTEKVVVGDGYAGKLDCLIRNQGLLTVVDFKTAGKIPKKSYTEHRMQMAAYAKAIGNTDYERIRTANIYISTKQPGEVVVSIQDEWERDWSAFSHLLKCWQIMNDYE